MKDKTYHEVVSEKFIASWQDLTKTAKPIIAAVNGYAVHNFLRGAANGISSEEDVNWR
jgi:enoyl-CoA hydratase/carnithine racemase